MRLYLIAVGLLRYVISFLLLLSTAFICRVEKRVLRLLLGAVLGGTYAVYCLIPNTHFPGNTVLYFIILLLMGIVSFGKQPMGVWAICVFVLLNLFMDAVLFGSSKPLKYFYICFIGLLLFAVLYRDNKSLIPVVIKYKDKIISFMALKDTGNMLKDPITGKSVLIVGADIAKQLFGIEKEQLRKPVDYIQKWPGFRLIPYHTIGKSGEMMLAIRLHDVKIDGRRRSEIIAFAPENIGYHGDYQALAGGSL